MANTASSQELARRIEQLVQEHIAASHKVARDALARAFATARTTMPSPARATRQVVASKGGKRRTPKEVEEMGERFYKAVCAKPGETMAVLAEDVGASARELNRPMNRLKKAGRVRSVGNKHFTRYFPMAGDASTSG